MKVLSRSQGHMRGCQLTTTRRARKEQRLYLAASRAQRADKACNPGLHVDQL